MQFTTPTQQQITTCPQCDNVVRIDAEFCNICGKRLRAASSLSQLSTAQQLEEDEEYEGDEDYLDEDEENEPGTTAFALNNTAPVVAFPLSASEILAQLRRLQEQTAHMERYFPADLPGKEQKLTAWKKQPQRALACVELFERPQLQQSETQQPLKLRYHIA